LSLRQEANRSTPSLLSQASPPRRSPSPGLRQSSGNPPNDWTRRNGSASGNTSPARSTFSLASTVNLYVTVSGTSNTTTPGKLAPSSPLYYDYTEDFEGDGYHQSEETLGLPPQFSIEKTIPEERPMTAEYRPSTELPMHPLSDDSSRLLPQRLLLHLQMLIETIERHCPVKENLKRSSPHSALETRIIIRQ
jgi:hypothetical protein